MHYIIHYETGNTGYTLDEQVLITFESPAAPSFMTKWARSIFWIAAGRLLPPCGGDGEGRELRTFRGHVGLSSTGDGMELRTTGSWLTCLGEAHVSGWRILAACEATSRERKDGLGCSALKLGTALPPPTGLSTEGLVGRQSPPDWGLLDLDVTCSTCCCILPKEGFKGAFCRGSGIFASPLADTANVEFLSETISRVF